MPAIPLKSELDVGPGRVAVLERIMTQVITVVGHRAAVKQLEKADRHVAVNLRHPARADLELGMKPVAAFVGVVIPGAGVLLQSLPFVPTVQVAAIGAVNHPFVEVRPVEVFSELPRQHDVGVEVENPVLGTDLVEPALNHPGLVERPVAAMIVRKHMVDRVLPAYRPRFLVVGRRDDDQIVEKWQVFGQGGREKIAVPNTDDHRFDSHLRISPITMKCCDNEQEHHVSADQCDQKIKQS